MINPAIFIGEPLNFKNKFLIYPPSIKEVIRNISSFNQYLRLLTITQDDIRDELNQANDTGYCPNPFEFLLGNCYNSAEFRQIAINAFRFFLHTEVHFLYEQKIIIVGNLEKAVRAATSLNDFIVINEEDYFDFQNAIREACGDKPQKPPEVPNPNEDPRIAAIKAKARARDRLKAKQNAKDGISLETCLVAICCMGIGITPLNIGEMSYASIGPIMKMIQDKEKYDIDIRSLLAGADSKKIKPKYWIRNSDKDE